MSVHASKCQQLSEKAFELAKPLLPVKAAEDIRAFIYEHNEWGLGIEVLVDVLLEERIAVRSEQKEAIVVAMDAMGIKGRQREIEVAS
jgi:ribonucleotide reductase alpha subunit